METIIALLVLLVVVIPVVVLFLVARVSKLTRDVDTLTQRLSEAEFRLNCLTKPAPPVSSEERTTPAPLPEQPTPVVWEPSQAPAAAAPAVTSTVPPPLESTPAPAWATTAFNDQTAPPEVPPLVPPVREPEAPAIDWEQFMGGKLFAWIGGFALFLGIAFFIKYSFDRNLIPPAARAAIGFLAGLGLLAGGVVVKRRELAVTSQTLCATGVVVLYAVTFACRSVYHFPLFGPWVTFVLMALITAAAFTLAVHLEARVVAVLGLVGGFLTPVLLATGQDNPTALFTYIALLDVGLLAVAFRRRWHFLVAMAAAGTVATQLGWCATFFVPEKVFVAMAIFLGFDLLFLVAFVIGEALEQTNDWLTASAVGLPLVTMAFAGNLISYATFGARPGVIFSFVLGADLCLLTLVALRAALQPVQWFGGGAVFLLLSTWTANYVTDALLGWALALCLIFAALHSLFPLWLARRSPGGADLRWSSVVGPVALLWILIPLSKGVATAALLWPAVLLLDLLAIGAAVAALSVGSILSVIALTMLAAGVWIWHQPPDLDILGGTLTVIAGFALFFFFATPWAVRRMANPVSADSENPEESPLDERAAEIMAQAPALAAILPFFLLMLLSWRLPLTDPTPVFAAALLFVALLLAGTLLTPVSALAPTALGCALALEYTWHVQHFTSEAAARPLLWHLAFCTVFAVFPFVFRRKLENNLLPWCASALAAPLHFYLVYHLVDVTWPNAYMGLLPAVFALPMLLAVAQVRTWYGPDAPLRMDLLAWFGGAALFFLTLIFPIQFERQWLTLGWALEGLALVWLFQRVPHPGLRGLGVVLLLIAFVRLSLNPAVLAYHRSSSMPIVNWYLYAYGVVTICLLSAARLLAGPRRLVWNVNMPPVLYTLGTILAFLLVNIEIADYFAEGDTLTFQFSGNFARDMTYSIAWALFALALLIIGMRKRLGPPRQAAIGLLVITLLKLFLHDLSVLGQLYRIVAFVVVAIILMFASFLYQRFVASERNRQPSS